MIPKTSYKSFFTAIYSVILKKEKSNKTSVEKLASTFGISDKNTIKEITENAIVTIARKIANQPNKTVKQKYDEIVDLYKSQVNLSHRTSQSMLLQQYSTPATLGYLMGIYCNVDQTGNYYEPSAGNGMLTIANSGKDFTVNEKDATRFQNLEFQDIFKLITQTDSSIDTYRSKYFDAIITNPPFSTVNKDQILVLGEYQIKHLDHKMSILALNSMKDNGKAAIIVGGHTTWDDKGRIQAGKNRIYLSYLYKNYNVEDVILVDGNALYSKMGTGFDTRIILINGRKAKQEGFAPLKNDVLAQVIKTTDDLYSRFSKHFKNRAISQKDFTLDEMLNDDIIKDAVARDDAALQEAGWNRKDIQGVADLVTKKSKNTSSKMKSIRLRAKAIAIKQKQLLQMGKLGAIKLLNTSWNSRRPVKEIDVTSIKPSASLAIINKIISEKVTDYDLHEANTGSMYLNFTEPKNDKNFNIRVSNHSKIDELDTEVIFDYNDTIEINIYSKERKDLAAEYLRDYFGKLPKLNPSKNVFVNKTEKRVLKSKHDEVVLKFFKKIKIDSTKTDKQIQEQILAYLVKKGTSASLTKREYVKSRGSYKLDREYQIKGNIRDISSTAKQITIGTDTGKDFSFDNQKDTYLTYIATSKSTDWLRLVELIIKMK